MAASRAGDGGGAPGAPTLVRAMGRWTLALLVVNAIVGSGIFGLPSVVSKHLGPLAPWAWVLGAVGNGVVMLCFAEVASRFTAAGGAYLYARESLPRLVAIEVGWLAFLTRMTAAAAGANLFTVNLAGLVPAAEQETVRLGALTLLLGTLTAVNVAGVEQGARWSNVFTVAKLVPLAILLVAGAAFLLLRGAIAPAAPASAASPDDWLRAGLLIAFAYGGYDGALMAMGEARDPRRDAPFALVAAMVALALLYTAVQLVVDGVLVDPAATERPLVEAASVVLGPWGGALLAAGTLVSIVGFLGANFLNSPRLGFALAENGDLPAVVGRVHPRFRTPYLAILGFGFLVWALAVAGSFAWNATLSAVSRLFVYGATCVALLALRRRDPHGARLRLPGGPVLATAGIAFCALLASRMGRAELVVVAVVTAVAAAHWALVRRGSGAAPTT
ncbi:MAG: amino acid permease [Acidobacteriota bacterium]